MPATNQETIDSLNRAWGERKRLWAEGRKLQEEGVKSHARGEKLFEDGNKRLAEGNRLWAEAVRATLGNTPMIWGKFNKEHQALECTLPERGLHFGF